MWARPMCGSLRRICGRKGPLRAMIKLRRCSWICMQTIFLVSKWMEAVKLLGPFWQCKSIVRLSMQAAINDASAFYHIWWPLLFLLPSHGSIVSFPFVPLSQFFALCLLTLCLPNLVFPLLLGHALPSRTVMVIQNLDTESYQDVNTKTTLATSFLPSGVKPSRILITYTEAKMKVQTRIQRNPIKGTSSHDLSQ